MATLQTISVILSITVLFFCAAATGKNKGQRQYNEQCVPYDTSSACDSSQGLLCLDSGLKGYRCMCPANKLHAQVFDTKRNACVGKVLNSCVRGSSKSSINETLCVDNAECNTVVYGMAVCLCKAGFAEKDDGSCTPSLKHGDPCISDDEEENDSSADTKQERAVKEQGLCDEKHGQKCIEGKCQCRFPSEQYYDAKAGKCISYAGGKCSNNGHVYSCVPNANCPSPPIRIGAVNPLGLPPLPSFLSAFASASAGAGGDREEIFVMPLRPRLPPPPPPPPPHRHSLHHHHPHPPFTREDAVMEFDTNFDNYDFARSIFFGSQNNKRKGEGNQGENADSTDPNQPRCQCLPGFSRTSDGFCMKGYGSKCNPEDDDTISGKNSSSNTNSGPRELCNADQFLECMDAHDGSFSCQCRNQMNERYDAERNECVAMVGRRCRPLGNYPKCEKGSECINGICTCANGTSLTPMETCAKDYDEECEPGQCNVWKGLTCHGKSKTCMCLDSYLRYDSRKKGCVASKGSMCGSVRSASSWGNSYIPEMAYVECEDGSECKAREIGGKNMGSTCI